MGLGGVAVPKGPTRKTLKGRKDRREAAIKKAIRALCVERDGECRIDSWEDHPDDFHAAWIDGCDGYSEWAHLERGKRARTRGMKPELRHTTTLSVMLCQFHHALYDSGEMRIAFTDDAVGADGALEFR